MNRPNTISPPWFAFVVGLALTWYLFGAWIYLAEVTLSEAALAALTEAQRNFVQATPRWVTGAWAVAVWGGVAGGIGLLLHQRWALPALILSLLGVVIHRGFALFVGNEHQVFGSGAIGMALLWVAVAALSIGLARLSRHERSFDAVDSPSAE